VPGKMSKKKLSPGAALVRHRWEKTTPAERSAIMKSVSRGAGGRPKKPTACSKCGVMCDGAVESRSHCRA
jgi:hypothetical protein